MNNILVIKHGALGDVVLATAAFKAIRHHHANAHITLLTTPPYAKLLRPSGYFNEILIDKKPKLYDVFGIMELAKQLQSRSFEWVYDLQTSTRSSFYYHLFPLHKPYYSGIAPRASHRHNTRERTHMHTLERQQEQLAIAGIRYTPEPDVSWLDADVSRFGLQEHFVLLVPGGSAHRPEKRWGKKGYMQIARQLSAEGITPVLIGAGAEASLLETMNAEVPEIKNLCNQTNFAELVTLARMAKAALGNDTGPMHLIAAAGCPSLVLFSSASDPALCAPRGKNVSILKKNDLETLSPEVVINALKQQMAA